MTGNLPIFMRGHEHAGKEASLRDDPEIWEARALLYGQYHADPDRFSELVCAAFYRGAPNNADWRAIARMYPEQSLEPSEHSTDEERYNESARAFVLREAVLRLLELNRAPRAMVADLDLFLGKHVVNVAEQRAFVQALALALPGASWPDICALANADYSQAMKDRKNDSIVDPPLEVGPTPGSTP